MAEKLRVHHLAKELGVTSKAILDKCRAEGLELKNHMAALSAGLAATIREWFSEGDHSTTIEQAKPVDIEKVRKAARKRSAKKAALAKEKDDASDADVAVAVADEPTDDASADASSESEVSTAAVAESPGEAAAAGAPDEGAPPAADEPSAPPAEEAEQPAIAAEAPEAAPAAPEPESEPEKPVAPAGPQNVPAPAQLQGPRVVRIERPDHISAPPRPSGPRRTVMPAAEGQEGPGGVRRGVPGGGMRRSGVGGEDARGRRGRINPRRSKSDTETVATERLREWRERDLIERKERMASAVGRGLHSRRARESRGGGGHHVAGPRTKAQVSEPIVMHEFCAATGIGMSQLMPTLMREHKIMPNRNMVLDPDLATVLAGEHGIELEIIKPLTAAEAIAEKCKERERPNPEPRPPVVTFLGHVDHGKTSLLDAIRRTRVTEGEAGGITQHIGAYRLDRDNLAVTFLDTPGHEAFTAMRARGANMTDVVVLVIAADDGVMPQTVEAISHAKQAKVPIVVALNKIDLPGIDANRVLGQLAEHQLVPSEWGGEVDVIRTSATTGEGIDDLLEHLSTLSELMELKADPTISAAGMVIEAKVREGVGVSTTVLVQEGTLRTGDVVWSGPGFGRVRAITDDLGNRLSEAPPATPVEISGLDEVPNAGDRFYVLESQSEAKHAAEEVRDARRQDTLYKLQKPTSLEDMFRSREEGEVPELNLILRADVQGSIDVLTSTLGDLPTDEVKLRILQAAVGPITEGDVILAEASNAIIVGFHVVAETSAKQMAEEKGVDVRLYRVIYNLTDEIRKALEGLLEPEKKEEYAGRAEVRNTFSVSKVGMVAGCYVTDGVIHRSDYVRLIRDGRILLPTEDDVARERHRSIHSLKRFKDDAKEVRSGFECGIKIEDYNDVKEGDTIEAYKVIEVSRTLS